MSHIAYRLLLAAAASLVWGTLAGAGGADETAAATRAWVADSGVRAAEIVAEEGLAPRFALVLTREMPTPGWTFAVDAVEADPDASRVVIRLTERRPEGIVAQVLAPTRLEVPLGPLAPGVYFVELWARRDPASTHDPAHALVVVAR